MQNTYTQNKSTSLNWTVNEFGQPVKSSYRKNYLKAMSHLSQNPYEIDQLPIARIKLIARTLYMPEDLDSKNARNILKVRAILLSKHPECFQHALTFQMGGIVQTIERYDFFKQQDCPVQDIIISLPYGMNPKNDRDIILCYLNYIRTANIDITIHNLDKIYSIAKQQNDEHLMSLCLNFVNSNYINNRLFKDIFEEFYNKHIDFGILIDLLNFSTLNNLNNLKWICLIFAYNNCNHEYIIHTMENEWLSKEGKDILNLGRDCNIFGLTPYFKEVKNYASNNALKRTVHIQSVSSEQEISSQLYVFTYLYNNLNVDGIDFHQQSDYVLFESLMSPFLKDSVRALNCLSYEFNEIENVPEQLFSNVTNLVLKGDGPQTLALQNTLYFSCEQSNSVANIECGIAKKIKCHDCTNLETLQAHQADEVDVKKCPKLALLVVTKQCRIINKNDLPKKCDIRYVD